MNSKLYGPSPHVTHICHAHLPSATVVPATLAVFKKLRRLIAVSGFILEIVAAGVFTPNNSAIIRCLSQKLSRAKNTSTVTRPSAAVCSTTLEEGAGG